MKLLVRNDGIEAPVGVSGVGGQFDNFANSSYNYSNLPQKINCASFQQLYQYNGIIKKIIDLPANDAVRNFINIDGDTDKDILNFLKQKQFKSFLARGLKMARLYGSALIVLDVMDGEMDASKPVNLNRVQDFEIVPYILTPMQFFPRYIGGNFIDYETFYYGVNLSNYSLSYKSGDTLPAGGYEVHKSRTILLLNEPLFLDYFNKFNNSTIFSIFDDVKRLDFISNITTKLMEISQYDVVSIDKDELVDLATNGSNSDQIAEIIKTRLEVLNKQKSAYNTMAMTSADQLNRIQSQFNGYDNIIEIYKDRLCAVSNVPTALLFGNRASGTTTNGVNELETYYNFVSGLQESILMPAITPILELTAKIIGMQSPTFTFNPLWQESEAEKINNRLKQAQADKIYIDSLANLDSVSAAKVVTSILKSRFGGDVYSFETKMDITSIANELEKSAMLDKTFEDPSAKDRQIKQDGWQKKLLKKFWRSKASQTYTDVF